MSYAEYNFQPVAKKVESIYLNRLNLFVAEGEFREYNLPKVLEHDRVHEDYVKLGVHSVKETHSRPPFEEAVKGDFRLASKGEQYGPSWATHWFKLQIKVPEHWSKAQDVIFNWDCGNEGLIFTEDGKVVVGLSGEERREWRVPDKYRDGQWHTFYIESACNGMFGNGDPSYNIQPPITDRHFTLVAADLVWPNNEARALKADFLAIAASAKTLDDNSWQKHKALEVANKIIDAFDIEDADNSIKRGREIAKEFLGDRVDTADVWSASDKSVVYALGHCHIDTAWLWPYAETRRKIGRSWATQLDLMDRYPEYTFVCSQSIQYKWLKEDYPELFDRVKQKVKEGRFIPIGGSFVESDLNIPSMEAIARQFLYGQRYFESNFGIRCTTFYLPDTFGYSASAPQLVRAAGMNSMITQKLSWNNINEFQATTLNWVGLDGSQIMAHFPPACTYTSDASMSDIKKSAENHKDRGIDQTSLLLFGKGDGGGGPTVEMLENLRRARGISNTVGELPEVSMGGDVTSFVDRVLKKTDNGKNLVSWVGEFYFEFHRGTYTSQANTKKGNRTGEILLKDLELLCTLVSIVNPDYKYPKSEIDELWELLLLNQFHDVLPGSCIELVYDDAEEHYAQIQKDGLQLIEEAAKAVAGSSDVTPINFMPWQRTEVAKFPAGAKVQGGQATDGGVYAQVSSGKGGAMVAQEASGATVKESNGVFTLDNGQLRASFEDGVITSIYDITAKREMIIPGSKGMQYCLFEDQPLNWQAWDTEIYSLNKRKNLKAGTVKIGDQGPVRASLVIEQQISEKSWLKTVVSLDAPVEGVPSVLRFDAEVEWRESCRFLKVEFPVDIQSDFASYDNMHGVVRRPTHCNTSWDVAKFEVCCHKYANLSDYSYGVTVINDCKYGFATKGNVMRLSLLRSPKAPDANCDMGRHNFSFAVVGSTKGLSGEVVQLAHNFNQPLRLLPTPKLDMDSVTFDGPDNIVVAAIKRGEDDVDVSTGDLPARKDKSVIVRLYDALGGRSVGHIKSKFPISKAYKTNLLEDDGEEVEVKQLDGAYAVQVEMGAFGISTYRLVLA